MSDDPDEDYFDLEEYDPLEDFRDAGEEDFDEDWEAGDF